MQTSTLARTGTLVAMSALLIGAASSLPAAADTRVTATEGVNIRSGASTTASVVGGLRRGQSVTAVKRTPTWTTIRFSGSTAYVSSRYLRSGARLSAPVRLGGGSFRVTTAVLNLRSGAGLSHRVQRVLPDGTRVKLTGESSNGFAEVTVGGSRGWLSSQYLASSAPRLPRVTGTRVATADLDVRTGSGASSTVVSVVDKGTRLSVTGVVRNGRAQIVHRKAVGWVTSKYLSRRSTAARPAPRSAVEKGLSPRAIALHRAAQQVWPGVKTYYGYRNDARSDHSRGNALDLMIPRYSTASGRAYGDRVARWAIANQRRLHVTYIIWDQRIWNVGRAGEGWRRMADRGGNSANHKDHVHISVR